MALGNPYKNCIWANKPVGDITQRFGQKRQAYTDMGMLGHNGIDLARGVGEPHYACEDAIVLHVKHDPAGYGKHVRFISTDGKRLWVYAHCSEIFVEQGQKIKEGDLVCLEGATGHVSGPHLHLGLRLTKFDNKGWAYEGSDIKIKVLNTNNGYKGSVDPLPYFLDPTLKSTKLLNLASLRQEKIFIKFAKLLSNIGL
jgi:murein DD-endopeptidase MepM/ murein hydrolase activator NlpD